MKFDLQRRNVLVLSLCQVLFTGSQATFIFLGSLIGYSLAEDKALATLPVSVVILGTAMMTIPASLYMRRVGRQFGFMTGALIGIAGALLCAWAVWAAQFWGFVAGALMVGFYNAFCQYYRFAAADTAEDNFKSQAISLVLAGGVVAAFIAPPLASATRDLLAPVAYLGSFLIVAAMAALALVLHLFLRIPRPAAGAISGPARPIGQIMAQPKFIIAVLCGMIAFGVMSLIMTATPLAMVACGLPEQSAGTVISWHIVAMFAPSFVTGHLIGRFGLVPVMSTGVVAFAGCTVLALAGVDFANFWFGLVLLGLGWNFLFIGGTTLLTETYSVAEREKTQAANDFLVFGTTATASLMSGVLLNGFGWSTVEGWDVVNIVAVPFIVVAAAAVAGLVLMRRRAAPAG